MQRALVFGVCASWVAADYAHGVAEVNNAASRPRGFADADSDSDASFKILRKHKLQKRHGDHRAVQRSSSSADSRQLQHEVEQMVSRVKHLSDNDARFEFAKELAAVEEEVGSNIEDKALMDQVSSVRADICTQLSLVESDAANCKSFMESACAKRPLKVPSQFCTKFLRQRKQGRTNAATTADAVRLTANDAVDDADAANAVAADVDSSDAGDSESSAEQYAASPAAAAGPGPAPGPAPMGPFFGGKGARRLPGQGFDGKYVEPYKDLEQQVEDWQVEFGPHAGHRNFRDICADHKGNEWCRLHGYYDHAEKPKSIMEEIFEVVPASGTPSAPRDPGTPGKSGSGAARLGGIPTLAIALAAVLLAQH